MSRMSFGRGTLITKSTALILQLSVHKRSQMIQSAWGNTTVGDRVENPNEKKSAFLFLLPTVAERHVKLDCDCDCDLDCYTA